TVSPSVVAPCAGLCCIVPVYSYADEGVASRFTEESSIIRNHSQGKGPKEKDEAEKEGVTVSRNSGHTPIKSHETPPTSVVGFLPIGLPTGLPRSGGLRGVSPQRGGSRGSPGEGPQVRAPGMRSGESVYPIALRPPRSGSHMSLHEARSRSVVGFSTRRRVNTRKYEIVY